MIETLTDPGPLMIVGGVTLLAVVLVAFAVVGDEETTDDTQPAQQTPREEPVHTPEQTPQRSPERTGGAYNDYQYDADRAPGVALPDDPVAVFDHKRESRPDERLYLRNIDFEAGEFTFVVSPDDTRDRQVLTIPIGDFISTYRAEDGLVRSVGAERRA